MTKKHFKIFAATIAAAPADQREAIAAPIIAACKADNPRFNESIFRAAACMVIRD